MAKNDHDLHFHLFWFHHFVHFHIFDEVINWWIVVNHMFRHSVVLNVIRPYGEYYRVERELCVVVLPSFYFVCAGFIVFDFVSGRLHRSRDFISTLVLPSLNRNCLGIISFVIHWFRVGEITQGRIVWYSRSPLYTFSEGYFDQC